MSVGLSNQLDALLTEVVEEQTEDGIRTSVDEANYFGMTGGGKHINVRGKRYKMWMTLNASIGYMPEAGTFLTGDVAKPAAMKTFVTVVTMTTSMSGRMLRQLESAQNAELKESMATYSALDVRAFADHLSQDMFGDGSGIKAIALSASSTTITFSATAAAQFAGQYKLRERGRYNWIDPATKLPRVNGGSTAFVSTVTENGITGGGSRQATFDALPSDYANGDWLVSEGTNGNAISGLLRHVANDSLDYQGLNRGKFNQLRSSSFDAGSAPPSYSNVQGGKYKAMIRGNGGGPLEILTSYTMQQLVENLGHPLRRYTENTKTQDIGFESFSLDGQKANAFLYCPADHLFRIRRSDFDWNVLTPLHIAQRDGRSFRYRPNGASYDDVCLLFRQMEADLACKNPRNQVVQKGYDVSGAELACDNLH